MCSPSVRKIAEIVHHTCYACTILHGTALNTHRSVWTVNNSTAEDCLIWAKTFAAVRTGFFNPQCKSDCKPVVCNCKSIMGLYHKTATNCYFGKSFIRKNVHVPFCCIWRHAKAHLIYLCVFFFSFFLIYIFILLPFWFLYDWLILLTEIKTQA